MVPSGTPNPVSGTQSVPPSLLRTNSGILVGTQAGSLPSQHPFPSLVSSGSQLNCNNNNSMSLLGNISNVSSLLNQSFGSGGSVSGIGLSATSVNLQQQSGVGGAADMLGPAELDPLSFISSSASAQGQHQQNLSVRQVALDRSHPEQLDRMQNFQRSFSMPHNQQQTQLREGLGNVGCVAPSKLEPLNSSDQNGPPQHLQSPCSIGTVKLEPQQPHSMGGLGPVKLERQHSDSALFLQQQRQPQQLQQQQLLQVPRPPSQAASAPISLLQQQRILQLQQQILKNLPQQRHQLQQQLQQNLPLRPQVKSTLYEPGMCARRLTHYMYHQQHRPDDNSIEFWRKFVAEYFAPNAKKRWCVSLYGSGRQTNGVFPQDAWRCEICNHKPGRGFETTIEVLPRLFQIKYASGTLEELLYVDMPREYQNALGQIVLDYAKAIQESVFEQLRVVREGQLRIVFSPDLKICSWEFCARHHEELIPRRLLTPQVSQLGTVVQKYQNSAQTSPSGLSAQDLQVTCNSFMATARQLAKALEVPLVNDLGYTKRYVRCLQISEVVNSMKDLIDYSRETRTGPMDSLINFPKRTSASSGLHSQQVQQPEDQQMIPVNTSHSDQTSAHATGVQLPPGSNAVRSVANSLNNMPSAVTATGLLRQNSMNSRQDNQTSSANGARAGNTVRIPSASSSNSLPPSQPNTSFPSPTPSMSNNIPTLTSHITSHHNSSYSPANMSTMKQPFTQSHEADPTETQSSVQKILQEIMMNPQLNGVSSLGIELKGINGTTAALNGGSCLGGSTIMNDSGVSVMGSGTIGGIGPLATAGASRAGMPNNSVAMNGQVGMNHTSQDSSAMNNQQQQDMGNRLLGGLGPVNSLNNLQFWKSSP